MVKGKVDANWAKQNHDLWYEKQDPAGGEEIPGDESLSAVTDKPG